METKEAGNAFFKTGDNENAILKYTEAIAALEPVSPRPPQPRPSVQALIEIGQGLLVRPVSDLLVS